ncbi:subtilisin-like protease SBT1.7 [Prunus yedoensis var. nudiflora]|uniref:Subtilisin-like protease SBT1.7 n=1 Tax=Prunus yedoensis var. nudiflora TaxID=2094558 RepID=A0A314Z7T2_PRUYE|nr:subtilisin-like protease SBT1.7 [Prunus yedoensis var. nudiflora]
MGIMSTSVMLLFLLGLCHLSTAAAVDKNDVASTTYIVHMAKSEMPTSFDHHTHWYDSSLKTVSDSAEMMYIYSNAIHGFSTKLTPEQAESLQSQPGVLSVLPELNNELHTTRTPEFLGLGQTTETIPQSNSESDVIIGVLDTGVWPESKSFDDTGLGPVPGSWKGACESGTNFNSSNCNRKLIGARYFAKGYEATLGPIETSKESKSPRDDDGHGTHTASTAAGSVVSDASLFGYALGTARGMAPRARIAAYKVCWVGGCFSSDIVAAIDQAIADNVNVLSMSLGGGMSDYFRDSVAIGAFSAMEKGILISCSAGNAGPSTYSLSNSAPWITTVGAGTLDRDFPAFVSLGNGKNFSGVSLYRGNSNAAPTTLTPFVYAGNASNATSGNLCMMGTLIPEQVKGKIVMCDRRGVNARVQKGAVVKAAGGAGMILANTAANGEELVADAHLLPATAVGQQNADVIKSYLFKDPNPTATILCQHPSWVVRGCRPHWTGDRCETRGVQYYLGDVNVLSARERASGAAEGAHPEWSPAAIRSALMTTAYTAYKNGQKLQDVATGKPSTPFDHGAGHVDPVSALNPGLVYDLTVDDYLNFLCALNYSASEINSLAKRSYTCDKKKKYSVRDLNYPSFAVNFGSRYGGGTTSSNVVKYTRTLTNVGPPGTYKASVTSESQLVKISVEPETLSFSQANEKKVYTVTLSAVGSVPANAVNSFGRVEWSDGKHIVGSPIAISWS